MSDAPLPDLKAEIWALALIRRAEVGGAYALVARKGDPDGGIVLVKVVHGLREARLYGPARDLNGNRVYQHVSRDWPEEDEAAVEAYLERRIKHDPDLWVVEVEDPHGRTFITEPVQ